MKSLRECFPNMLLSIGRKILNDDEPIVWDGVRIKLIRNGIWLGIFGTLLVFSGIAFSSDYSIPVGKNYPKNVYWGDTHLHSRNSADAYSLGNMNLTPGDAYRFARGQEIVAHNGMKVQLRRPLDFLVVSDHAEYLGGYYRFFVDDPLVTETLAGRRWERLIQGEEVDGSDSIGASISSLMAEFTGSMDDGVTHPPLPELTRMSIWQDVALTSDLHNQPGVFTTLTGYEWTVAVRGNNLHRVVIYKDGAEKVAQLPPFSGQDSNDPRDLWKALQRYEEKTGGEVIAIAHNGNISNGMMFPDRSIDGKPIDKAYARLRARWEPIYEVTQVKGDGESHPTLSPNDEFADFETWDEDNIGRNEKKQDWMLQHEYARGALKLGLLYEDKLGVNPFKIGLIGSTDGHNSISTPEEDNFFGKFPESEPSTQRMYNAMANDRLWKNWKIVASGYAAIWAHENTRDSLFAAMKRREVYATTGSRITLRFFGGWAYQPSDIQVPDWLDIAYTSGVPMGGDLFKAPKGQAPKFIIFASKDPDGANLDRVQVVKGWLDDKNMLHEKVYDVAWSGNRSIDSVTGKLESVGSTVNVKEASYENTIGDINLRAVW